MFPNFFSCCSHLETSRMKKKNMMITNRHQNLDREKFEVNPQLLYFHGNPLGSGKQTKLSLRSDMVKVKPMTKGEMPGRFSNISDLIQKVAAACKLHPPASSDEEPYHTHNEDEKEEVMGMEFVIMTEVFDAVSAMKIAYVSLQEAHNPPWDPEKLRAADVAVVGELRKLGALRERYFRRRCNDGDMLREVVAPYEAAVEELKREVKARDMEVDNLKEKLKSIVRETNGGKKSWTSLSRRKVYCITETQVRAAPTPELFEGAMSQVRESTETFTLLLLSHMRAAHWDIAAAVRSIEATTATAAMISASSIIQTQHANAEYALQSYISRKVLQGFDHESFYMDNSLSSLLNLDQYRRDCFTQYCDMKKMDYTELLDILPSCNFGKFCSNKYLAIVHPKMEESFFGDLEQRRQVVEGRHPRSQFYGHFLALAKEVWLLHLLAFSLDPAPCQFEASRGAEFHPHYMESVVKFTGELVPSGQVVGFPISPGFKLGNGSIIEAGVYLVSEN
ncbi:hypothetical protein M0R45_017340 [Rubus argutus]|uniref:DUF641 domain-containing protein n=1 Tax=Rubus argutus TaxID=59490 RepID=A0AAW1XY26_RUBAR